MNDPQKKRLQQLFAMSIVSGGLTGLTRDAGAQSCACASNTVTRTIEQSSFLRIDGEVLGYSVSLNNDTAYGFSSATAPIIYVDYYTSSGNSVWASVCKQPYYGGAAVCAPQANVDATQSQYYDTNVSTAGLYGANAGSWDYYYLFLASSSPIAPIGAGEYLSLGCC